MLVTKIPQNSKLHSSEHTKKRKLNMGLVIPYYDFDMYQNTPIFRFSLIVRYVLRKPKKCMYPYKM